MKTKLDKFEKIVLGIIFIFVIIGVVWARIDEPSFKLHYVREDHFTEWMSVVALVLGSILCFYRVWVFRNSRKFLFLASTFVLGCLYFFGAGEELSWGQRIFGIQSSDFFMTHNSQGETNIHNLVIGETKINKLVFGLMLGIFIGIYFIIFPVLYRNFEWAKKWINKLAMPLPTYVHIGAYIVLFLLAELSGSGKKGELLELGGTWIFLMMTLNPYNHEIFKRD